MQISHDVLAFLKSNFPQEQHEEALSILGQARIEDGSAPDPRLLRCASIAAHGDLLQLRRLVSLLAVDWRDVIMTGEYELRDNVQVRVRDLSQPLQAKQLIQADSASQVT